jgi:hypothetical protein
VLVGVCWVFAFLSLQIHAGKSSIQFWGALAFIATVLHWLGHAKRVDSPSPGGEQERAFFNQLFGGEGVLSSDGRTRLTQLDVKVTEMDATLPTLPLSEQHAALQELMRVTDSRDELRDLLGR